MANVYVWSGATGGGTGADWANAYTTLAAAATAKAAGDVFFVAHDHVETQASAKTITFAGTEVNPNKVYCADRAGSVPPVAADLRTTAQILTTGAFAINVAGSLLECYGLIFQAGDGASAANVNLGTVSNKSQRFTNCSFRLGGTGTTSRLVCNSSANANTVYCRNCTFQVANVNQFMNTAGKVIWRNTPGLILGAIIPTNLLSFSGPGSWFFEGCDLSAMGSGKTIVNGATTSAACSAILKDCKLGASVGIVSAIPTTFGGVDSTIIRCDSGDTNYRTEKYAFSGTQSVETSIVRTGGASDGTTPIAWKFVTTANSKWEWPLESIPISIWNETVGSPITVTLQGIWGTGTVPNNDDIWIDVEYLGTSGVPLASELSGTKATGLSANAALAAGSGTWGGSTTKFAMSVTLTPQEKGPLTIYVKAAKASSTFYVDPKPIIT